MASKNEVKLTFAGDSKSLEKTFSRVGQGAKEMAGDFDKAAADAKRFGDKIDSAGGAVGDTESKFMGTADVLDGLATTMGFNIDRQIELARGFGDIAGGIENLKGTLGGGINKLQDMATSLKAGGKAAVMAKVETVKSLAVQSAAWVKSSAQAMASAIRVRAAWLISMGPIALVVAAVAGAVFLIVKYWDEIKDAANATWNWVKDRFNQLKDFFIQWAPLLAGPMGLVIKYWDELKQAATEAKNWIQGRFNDVVSFLSEIPGRIGRNLTGAFNGIKEGASTAKTWINDRFDEVVTFLTGIPGRIGRGMTGAFNGIREAASGAVSSIKSMFESVVTFFKNLPGRIASAIRAGAGSIASALRSLVPNIDLSPGFDVPGVPFFHSGGVVPGPRGTEQPIMALAGERVLPLSRSDGGGGDTYIIQVAAGVDGNGVVRALQEHVRRNGPLRGVLA